MKSEVSKAKNRISRSKREGSAERSRFKSVAAAFALLSLSLWTVSATGQTPQESRPRQTESPVVKDDASKSNVSREADSSSSRIIFASSEDYLIGPSDVIEINIMDAPELSSKFTVSASGFIPMPFLGDLMVKKKSPAEVARVIADGLRGDYLKDPRVTVTVVQYNSRSFFIQGSVRSPGVYQIRGKASLLQLIIVAGGLADNHGSTAFIIRQLKPGSNTIADNPNTPRTVSDDSTAEAPAQYEMLQANISGLLKGHFEQNMIIEPGDIVNIPTTDVFFVAGEVTAPGEFPLKPGTSLRQAISLARGMSFQAAKGNGRIFRDNPKTGEREEIAVDIGAVMDGKKDDVPIMANDIIIVPNSRFKSVGGALLRAFGMATVNRGVY